MNFGVPTQRRTTTKVEKYPNTPVATLVVAEAGKGKKIYFNEKAEQLMGLPEEGATIAFSFEGGIHVVNGNNPAIPEEVKLNVSKSSPRRISDKRTYEYIIKSLDLNDQVENEFQLIQNTIDGMTVWTFELMKSTGEEDLYHAEVVGETQLTNESTWNNG
jgi:hypothetical protein